MSRSGILTFRLVKFLKVKIVIMVFIKSTFLIWVALFKIKVMMSFSKISVVLFKIEEIFFIDQGSFLIDDAFLY